MFFQALGAIKSLRKHKQPTCLRDLSHFRYIQNFFSFAFQMFPADLREQTFLVNAEHTGV